MPGVRARYWNAGHLLGSASIEIEFAGAGSGGQPLRLLASGDIGPDAKLLQPDPKAPTGFDYVISESTYGDADRAGDDAGSSAASVWPPRCATPQRPRAPCSSRPSPSSAPRN